MDRLRKFILNLFTILSLILVLASAGLWVRSHCSADLVERFKIDVWHDDQGKCGWEQSLYLAWNQGKLYLARRTWGPYHFADGDEQSRTTNNWTPDNEPPADWSPLGESSGESAAPPGWSHFGLDYTDEEVTTGRYIEARIPFYLITALALLLPAIRSAKWLRHRLRPLRRGLCVGCGYDLRATPAPQVKLFEKCPECGAACKAADPAGESPAAGN